MEGWIARRTGTATKLLSAGGIAAGVSAVASAVKGAAAGLATMMGAASALIAPFAIIAAAVGSILVGVAGIAAELNGGQLLGMDWSKNIARGVPGASGIIAEYEGIEAAANSVAEAGKRANEALAKREDGSAGLRDRATAARDYVAALADQHRQMRELALQQGQSDGADNPILDAMAWKIQQARAEAEILADAADLADEISANNAELERQKKAMAELADLQTKAFEFGANDRQAAILAVQVRAEALKDEFRELGKLTHAVAANIDRIAGKKIDNIIQQPIQDLRDEVVDLQVNAGGPGVGTDMAALRADYARAVRDAQKQGIADPAYYNLLREKYALLAQQLQVDAAKAIADANADLEFDIGELEIENSLDGLDEKLALLQHRLKRDLAEAVEQGLDPELVKRKYALLAEAAKLEFEPELPNVSVGGTFDGRLAGQILGGSAVGRIAAATEETARNTGRMARRGGTNPTFTA